eukprot:6210899-Pleurochrysis_carterae.AAC.2
MLTSQGYRKTLKPEETGYSSLHPLIYTWLLEATSKKAQTTAIHDYKRQKSSIARPLPPFRQEQPALSLQA